jgi:predicted O-methyltransferase YrrM
VSKLLKLIKAISVIVKRPYLLNKVLEDDNHWYDYLGVSENQGLPHLDLLELIPGLDEEIAGITFLGGGSMPTDFALLQSMAKRFNNTSYFEIGTWRGESVANIAPYCESCHTLNLSHKEMQAMGLSDNYAKMHGILSKPNPKIVHLEGNSLKYDFGTLNKKFDLIFIDGDHHYESVKSDTQNVFKHLVHDASIVVWHDAAYHPEKQRPEVIAGILDGLNAEQKQHVYHVSNTMCAVFIKGDFEKKLLKTPVKPSNIFKVNVAGFKG